MRPKRYLSLWYVWRTPSPNGPDGTPNRTRIPHDPYQLGVPSGASKTISKPILGSTQKHATILHRRQHCLETNRNEISHDPHHLGVPSGASKMIFEPMVYSAQTVHLSCIRISTVSRWTETSFHLILVTKEYHWVHPN